MLDSSILAGVFWVLKIRGRALLSNGDQPSIVVQSRSAIVLPLPILIQGRALPDMMYTSMAKSASNVYSETTRTRSNN